MENTQKVVLFILVPIWLVGLLLLGIATGTSELLSMAIILSLFLVIIAHCVSRIAESVLAIIKIVKANSYLSNIIERIQSMNPEYQECLEVMDQRKANYAVYWSMLNQI